MAVPVSTVKCFLHAGTASPRIVEAGSLRPVSIDEMTARSRVRWCVYAIGIRSNLRSILIVRDLLPTTPAGSRLYIGSPELYDACPNKSDSDEVFKYLNAGGYSINGSSRWVMLCDNVACALELCVKYPTKVTALNRADMGFFAELQESAGLVQSALMLQFVKSVLDPRWYLRSDSQNLFRLEVKFGIHTSRKRMRNCSNVALLLDMYNSLSTNSVVLREARARVPVITDAQSISRRRAVGCRLLLQFLTRHWLDRLTGLGWFDPDKFYLERRKRSSDTI